jgi:hypothetical protein
MVIDIPDTLWAHIVACAAKHRATDDVPNAYEDSGGNFDDAYEYGYADGEAALANEIINRTENVNGFALTFN